MKIEAQDLGMTIRQNVTSMRHPGTKNWKVLSVEMKVNLLACFQSFPRSLEFFLNQTTAVQILELLTMGCCD